MAASARLIAALALLGLVAGCAPSAQRVDAADHDAFWLWAGVQPQPVLAQARTLYVLAGEVRANAPDRVEPMRAGVPRLPHAELWLVYRVETTGWGNALPERMRRDLAAWRAAGNRVAGVQIDFDAATRGLAGYARALRALRAELPADARLSVTGLADWASQADVADLRTLGGVADEIVIQTYQGRQTVPDHRRYADRFARMPVPFKVGLVQGGTWQEPDGLSDNPLFRGYVVFLVNR